MNRVEFDKLSVERQTIEFNKLYEIHKSIRKVCAEIGISKTTVRDRFKNAGYALSEGIGYVKNTNTQLEGQTSLIEPVCENKEHNMLEIEQLVNDLVEKKFKELLKENPVHKDIELSPKCNGKVKYRAFGIYQQVLDEVIPWAKEQRFTLIEILSQSLLEFKKNHE